MNVNRIAEEKDHEGINSVILTNHLKKDDLYKYPCLFGDSKEIAQTKNQIIFVTEKDNTIIAFLSLHNFDLIAHRIEAEFELVVHPHYRDRDKHYGETLLRYRI
jgi:hypothetical protein